MAQLPMVKAGDVIKSSAHNAVATQVNTNTNDLVTANTNIESAKTTANAASTKANAVETKVTELTTKVGGFDTRITNNATAITAINNNIQHLTTGFNDVILQNAGSTFLLIFTRVNDDEPLILDLAELIQFIKNG